MELGHRQEGRLQRLGGQQLLLPGPLLPLALQLALTLLLPLALQLFLPLTLLLPLALPLLLPLPVGLALPLTLSLSPQLLIYLQPVGDREGSGPPWEQGQGHSQGLPQWWLQGPAIT